MSDKPEDDFLRRAWTAARAQTIVVPGLIPREDLRTTDDFVTELRAAYITARNRQTMTRFGR